MLAANKVATGSNILAKTVNISVYSEGKQDKQECLKDPVEIDQSNWVLQRFSFLNWLAQVCPNCGGPARPAILMFGLSPARFAEPVSIPISCKNARCLSFLTFVLLQKKKFALAFQRCLGLWEGSFVSQVFGSKTSSARRDFLFKQFTQCFLGFHARILCNTYSVLEWWSNTASCAPCQAGRWLCLARQWCSRGPCPCSGVGRCSLGSW